MRGATFGIHGIKSAVISRHVYNDTGTLTVTFTDDEGYEGRISLYADHGQAVPILTDVPSVKMTAADIGLVAR